MEKKNVEISESKGYVIAFKQGGNWVVSINGLEQQLHYSIQTREQVRAWFDAVYAHRGYTFDFG